MDHARLRYAFMILTCCVGCSGGTPEDRTVEFSPNGKHVAFQHGDNGVFIADSKLGKSRKLFQPDADVLATSRPMSSPTDGRMLFTTAKLLNPTPDAAATPVSFEWSAGEGRVFLGFPVRYWCWLVDDVQLNSNACPTSVFEATCWNLGYVAAARAARWSPGGRRITYLASVDDQLPMHTLFEFDLDSQKHQRILPFNANEIVFDWSPSGELLVCAVDQIQFCDETQSGPWPTTGLWVGQSHDSTSWRPVPHSEQQLSDNSGSKIEVLRRLLPTWTKDATQFAFVAPAKISQPTNTNGTACAGSSVDRIYVVQAASLESKVWAETDGAFRDLHWSPKGNQLGFLENESMSIDTTLRIAAADGSKRTVPQPCSIKSFAGFNTTGSQIAYVTSATSVTQPSSRQGSTNWSQVIVEDTQARDTIWLMNVDEAGFGHEIFSGLRVTFPHWSPSDDRLSCWLTFVPNYNLSMPLTLAGDPAITIDVSTGTINWLPVNQFEYRQVAHYYLSRGDAETAWNWYSRAATAPPTLPASSGHQALWVTPIQSDPTPLFESICLTRLGRSDEAMAKRETFKHELFASLKSLVSTDDRSAGQVVAVSEPVANPGQLEPWARSHFLHQVVYDLFLALTYLAVDSPTDAQSHLLQLCRTQQMDQQLSAMLVYSQLLLLKGENAEYADYCSETLIPGAAAYLSKLGTQESDRPDGWERELEATSMYIGACLFPLFQSDFLGSLSPTTRKQLEEDWNGRRITSAEGSVLRLACELGLRALARCAKDSTFCALCEKQIESNKFFPLLVPSRSFANFDQARE